MKKVSWNRLLAALKDHEHLHRDFEFGARDALSGRCVQVSQVLAAMIGGRYVRGIYRGEMRHSEHAMWELHDDFPNSHPHSWVELDGKILDGTWWAFTDAKMGIYEFLVTDERYTERAA